MSAVNRISISTTIPGDNIGLKTFIQQFLTKLNIGCEVERVLGEDGYSTFVLMESTESQIQSGKLQLIAALKNRFPQLQIPTDSGWTMQYSSEAQLQTRIHHTSSPAVPRRNSSGEISKMELLDGITPDDSASALGARSLSLLEHVGHILKKTERTTITVTYKEGSESRTADFDITTLTSWKAFLKKVDESPELAIPIQTRRIYRLLPDGRPSYASELAALHSGIEYFVETDLDKPPRNKKEKIADLNEFYAKLKSHQKLTDEQIDKIKSVFIEQEINLEQLIVTGELALTDEKLKEYGIKQGGLRIAILSVIKNLKD